MFKGFNPTPAEALASLAQLKAQAIVAERAGVNRLEISHFDLKVALRLLGQAGYIRVEGNI